MGDYCIYITGVMKRRERKKKKIEKRGQSLFEDIIVENFPNLRKKMDTQIKEAQKALTSRTE